MDSQYETNYKKAKAAGLHVGAYYYTVCTSVAEAKKDAEHIIGLLKGHEFDMPIYMDVEDPRQFKLSKRELTDVIKAFCDALIKAGYYAGLYIQGSA
jgi:GH25 family lysozyme M1 (1,4-beta-N-acetylmuramidase)